MGIFSLKSSVINFYCTVLLFSIACLSCHLRKIHKLFYDKQVRNYRENKEKASHLPQTHEKQTNVR
jgi:hypothetical protein